VLAAVKAWPNKRQRTPHLGRNGQP